MSMIELKQVAAVNFPTRWARFRLMAYEALLCGTNSADGRKGTALALVAGDIYRSAPIVRIHSQCTTGDIFHSLRCDCHDQLHLALDAIAQQGAGVLIYEHMEGRGIGLMEKLKAYELQDEGLDTIEANLRLGHPVDMRDYQLAVAILFRLDLRSVRLMTNNPDKIAAVLSSGIDIEERLSADVPVHPCCAQYISTKRDKLGHLSMSS